MNNKYVAYIASCPKKQGQKRSSLHPFSDQEKILEKYCFEHLDAEPLKTFVEVGDTKNTPSSWPELDKAVKYASQQKAILIIPELGNLTSNQYFVSFINKYLQTKKSNADFKPEIICCEQPYINADNFKAIVAHSMQQKKLHGQLIKAGLNRSCSRSGNPNAAKIIKKVNKPKVDNAIVFSLILSPIIHYYLREGYSQRKLAAKLNEDGLTAPEGGKWVLSQLQKVLCRIKYNDSALSLDKQIEKMRQQGFDSEKIATQFNKLNVPPPENGHWEAKCVEKVETRIQEIQDIVEFHDFILNLNPILEKYQMDELDEDTFANELQIANIQIPAAFYANNRSQ